MLGLDLCIWQWARLWRTTLRCLFCPFSWHLMNVWVVLMVASHLTCIPTSGRLSPKFFSYWSRTSCHWCWQNKTKLCHFGGQYLEMYVYSHKKRHPEYTFRSELGRRRKETIWPIHHAPGSWKCLFRSAWTSWREPLTTPNDITFGPKCTSAMSATWGQRSRGKAGGL